MFRNELFTADGIGWAAAYGKHLVDWQRYEEFPTWRQAMDYALRQSITGTHQVTFRAHRQEH